MNPNEILHIKDAVKRHIDSAYTEWFTFDELCNDLKLDKEAINLVLLGLVATGKLEVRYKVNCSGALLHNTYKYYYNIPRTIYNEHTQCVHHVSPGDIIPIYQKI